MENKKICGHDWAPWAQHRRAANSSMSECGSIPKTLSGDRRMLDYHGLMAAMETVLLFPAVRGVYAYIHSVRIVVPGQT